MMLVKNSGKKSLFGGPSDGVFFTLSHTLNAYADQIENLLTTKGFKYVLTRRKNNKPIENRFSVIRHLGGNHLALDVSIFACNERTLFLLRIRKLFTHQDGSHARIT